MSTPVFYSRPPPILVSASRATSQRIHYNNPTLDCQHATNILQMPKDSPAGCSTADLLIEAEENLLSLQRKMYGC